MATVSVIIPLYNRKNLIAETLSSLSHKIHSNVTLDIIVVDDGSTDGGAEWVEENYKFVRLFRQINSGAPTARNLGLKNAIGDYVLFLDSDDLIEPDFFSKKIDFLEKNREIVAVYGPWEHFEIGKTGERVTLPRHSNYPIDGTPDFESHLQRLLSGWYIVCHALLWRKDTLLVLDGYDSTLPVNQDVDLLFRALASKSLIAGVNAPLALYRSHYEESRVGSISSQKLIEIYNLRIKFVTTLRKEGLANEHNLSELSKFCFQFWEANRKTSPDVAEKFYLLSKELYPKLKLKLKGGKLLQLLTKLFGTKKAYIIKSWLK